MARGNRRLLAGSKSASVSGASLWRVDPTSNQVDGTTDLGPSPAAGVPNGVAAGYGSVWVAGADADSALRLQPR